MPEKPPDLPRLLPATDPGDRVTVQQTSFSLRRPRTLRVQRLERGGSEPRGRRLSLRRHRHRRTRRCLPAAVRRATSARTPPPSHRRNRHGPGRGRLQGRPQPVLLPVPAGSAVVIANGTIEATRLALDSLGAGDRTANPGSPRLGNLTAHLRSNITVRIRRAALGLPPGPPSDVETTAFLARGQGSGGRQFHLQLSAAAVGVRRPRAQHVAAAARYRTRSPRSARTRTQSWITIVLRCMGEMEGDQGIPPDPTRSWIDLSSETDEHQQRRAYVNLVSTAADGPMLVIEVRDDDADEEPGDHRHMSALFEPNPPWLRGRPLAATSAAARGRCW